MQANLDACPLMGGRDESVHRWGSGKLGQYMVQQSLDCGHEVVGVCREQSMGKLDAFKGRITVIPGATDDREVIKRAVAGCDGVLVVMTPRGVHGYSTGTTQAVLDYTPLQRNTSERPAEPHRLVASS